MSVPADSDSAAEEDTTLVDAIRTVTPPTPNRSNLQMNTFGWGLVFGMVILLIPLLPFVVIIWGISKVLERST
ncbi:MAG: hypothetical protein ACI9PP_000825 [Halobacteriales archaeon]|jgi:hypothetical protein